jgi:hypothetical protein
VRLLSFLAVLAVLGGVAYAGREAISKTVRDIQDNLSGDYVHAQQMVTWNEIDGRGAAKSLDRGGVTSWSAKVPGNTGDQYLEADFEKPFRLVYMFIGGSASTNAEERLPTKMEIITAGGGSEQISLTSIELQDVAELQRFYIGADGVSKVRIRILKSTVPEDESVSVAEVQFWGW